jgi:hypothetical protein
MYPISTKVGIIISIWAFIIDDRLIVLDSLGIMFPNKIGAIAAKDKYSQ